MSLMALVAMFNQGVGYFLGASVSSAKKDDAIANLTAPPATDATTVKP